MSRLILLNIIVRVVQSAVNKAPCQSIKNLVDGNSRLKIPCLHHQERERKSNPMSYELLVAGWELNANRVQPTPRLET